MITITYLNYAFLYVSLCLVLNTVYDTKALHFTRNTQAYVFWFCLMHILFHVWRSLWSHLPLFLWWDCLEPNQHCWWQTWAGQTPAATLAYWGLNKMAAILQMTFANQLPWMKMFILWFKFHQILYLRVQFTVTLITAFLQFLIDIAQVPNLYLNH